MIICWDNLEEKNFRLSKKGNFRSEDGATYYYHESCKFCKEPFLSKAKNHNSYCSYECMCQDEDYRKSVGKYKSNLEIKNDVLTFIEIEALRNKFPRQYIKIIKNQYPNTVIAIEIFCKDFNPKIKNFSQKVYHYINQLSDYPKCKICAKKITKFTSIIKNYGYNDVCSAGCKQKTSEMREFKRNVKHVSKKDILIFVNSNNETVLNYEQIKEEINNYLNLNLSNLEISLYLNNPNLLWNVYNSIKIGSSFLEKVFLLINNLKEIPLCKNCNKRKLNFINFNKGYSNVCKKCKKEYDVKFKEEAYTFNKLVRDEIKDLLRQKLKSLDKLTKNETVLIKNHKNLYENILIETSYLNEEKRIIRLSERIYHILNDLYEIPKCKLCGKIINQNFSTFEKNYSDICKECSCKENGIKNGKILSKSLRSKRYDFYKQYIIKENEYEIINTKEEFIISGELEFLHKKCGNTFKRYGAYLNGCPLCFKKHKNQNTLSLWLKNYVDVEIDKRKYLDNKFEIDIYIPSKKIGIEYDDLWTHSENSGNKSKNYHLSKTLLCDQKDINLIHIWNCEWNSKRKISKSLILSKLGIFENRIYGRKCEIKSLSDNEAKLFLEENHLQGKCNSSIRYGLFYNDELISCMVFGKRKITGKSTFELLRFCNKLNTQIIGGASKLLNHFIQNNEFGTLISYSDRRWFNGDIYKKLGFTFDHYSAPSYWYIVDGKPIHRSFYMKHKLPKLLKNYDPNLTEWENMQVNGYDRIWDCGCSVYVLDK